MDQEQRYWIEQFSTSDCPCCAMYTWKVVSQDFESLPFACESDAEEFLQEKLKEVEQ